MSKSRLYLFRGPGEAFRIGDDVWVEVERKRGDSGKLVFFIYAPRSVKVVREERGNEQAD